MIVASSAGAKKRSMQLEAERKQRLEELTASIEKAQQEYANYFGEKGEFTLNDRIHKLILEEKDTVNSLKDDYLELLGRVGKGAQLAGFDRLNLAMIFVRKQAETSSDKWLKLKNLAAKDNIAMTDFNRSLVAWLKDIPK